MKLIKILALCLAGLVSNIATADAWGPRQLADLVIDVALIGSNGISLKHGCTTPSDAVSATKRLFIPRACQLDPAIEAGTGRHNFKNNAEIV